MMVKTLNRYNHRNTRKEKVNESEFLRDLVIATRTPKHTPDGVQLVFTRRTSLLQHLVSIEGIVLHIANSHDDCFKVKRGNPIPANTLGKNILNAFAYEMEMIEDYIEYFQLSPGIKLFLEEFQKIEPRSLVFFNPNLRENAQKVCNILNTTVSNIRARTNTPEFRKRIHNFRRSSEKNLASFRAYINKCFETHSRLLAIRIDLSYKKGAFSDKSFSEAFQMAQDDWKKWIRRFKKNMAKAYVGYAKILEYGIEKSFHFHVLLLLNGSLTREDVTISILAGKDWTDVVTEGKGLYHNCHLEKNKYHRLGIGMIHTADKEKREVLDVIMAYMIKIDYFMKLVAPDGSRVFSKGDMPRDKLKLGRPRKTSTT